MTARQKARRAASAAVHACRQDNRSRYTVSVSVDGEPIPWPPERDKGARRGPAVPKPSARKTRRLIVHASRKANRV